MARCNEDLNDATIVLLLVNLGMCSLLPPQHQRTGMCMTFIVKRTTALKTHRPVSISKSRLKITEPIQSSIMFTGDRNIYWNFSICWLDFKLDEEGLSVTHYPLLLETHFLIRFNVHLIWQKLEFLLHRVKQSEGWTPLSIDTLQWDNEREQSR